SLLGVGTDLAGSVRIPAHFCGVVGIKTTSGRMSTRGIARPINAAGAGGEGVKSHQLWQALEEKQVYVEQLTEAWRKARLDLLLAPAFSMPAPPLNCPTNTTAALITTCLYNFCDFPSGVVPVTHEDEDDQAKLNDYPTDDLLFHMVKE
ncbi:hypothetical protein OTU49_008199, partial [Cherax quadricarinatus]